MCKQHHRTVLNPFLNGTKSSDVDSRFKRSLTDVLQCLQELLEEHRSSHSGDDKPYKCQFCGKGFKNRYHVRDHENTHTDTAEFKCTVCEKVQKAFHLKCLRFKVC